MRAGYAVSVIGHVAILAFGFLALPEGDAFEAEVVDALPVELVEVSDVTDLLEGEKTAEELPTELPQPKPEAQAPAHAPTPAEKPVEAAQAPAPRPEPPPPEPEPEPEPEAEPEQVASLPERIEELLPPPEVAPEPLPAEAPEPVVAAPPEPRVPKARPKPPKPVAQPKTVPQEPERTIADMIPKETEQDLTSLVEQALLNKQQPAGGGDPAPATEPQTIGSLTGSADAAMTQSWLVALTSKLAGCWRPPVGVREARNLLVSVEFRLSPDGQLAAAPTVMNGSYDPLFQVAAETATRAVSQCAPYADIFPPEHYGIWGQPITVDFDPREMFGAG